MRSLSVFFKQVRFIQNGKNSLSCHFGELPVVLKRRMVSGDCRAKLDAEAAGPGQQAARRQHLARAEYRDRHDWHLALNGRGKRTGAKTADPGLFDKRAFREKGQGFAILCGLDDLACVARTARRRESLYETRACAS